MKPEDLERLAEMKARREENSTIAAYFKLQGYKEPEILQAIESTPEAELTEEPEPINMAQITTRKRSKSELVIAVLLLFALIGIVSYVLLPMFPELSLFNEPKANWKVSSVPLSCSPSRVILDAKNADISGMPVTQFSIKENNATCVPPTNLQSTGIGETLRCDGAFEDESVYTLISPISIDDGFVCRYQ